MLRSRSEGAKEGRGTVVRAPANCVNSKHSTYTHQIATAIPWRWLAAGVGSARLAAGVGSATTCAEGDPFGAS